MTHGEYSAQVGIVENLQVKIPTALLRDNSNQIESLINEMKIEDIIQAQNIGRVFAQKQRQKKV
jgi:hypothetical protein